MKVLFRDVMIGSVVRTGGGRLLGKTSNHRRKANAVTATGAEVILPLEATVEIRHSAVKMMAAMMRAEEKREAEQIEAARDRARRVQQQEAA